MLRKTSKFNNRKDGIYTDRVLIETWWFFGFIPVYTRQTITATNR